MIGDAKWRAHLPLKCLWCMERLYEHPFGLPCYQLFTFELTDSEHDLVADSDLYAIKGAS